MAASFNVTVNIAATTATVKAAIDTKDKMAALEAQQARRPTRPCHAHAAQLQQSSKPPGKTQVTFVKAGGAEANRDEIALDDDDAAVGKAVEEKAVPAAVFGGITTDTAMGAKARFQAKAQ